MVTQRALERLRHFIVSQGKSNVLKFLQRLPLGHPSAQVATAGGRTFVIGTLLGQGGKIRPGLQCRINGVDTHLGCLEFLGRSFLRHPHQDVGNANQASGLMAAFIWS